jgi:hypothetical protein
MVVAQLEMYIEKPESVKVLYKADICVAECALILSRHAIYSLPRFKTPMFRDLVAAMKTCYTEGLESAEVVGVDARLLNTTLQNIAGTLAKVGANLDTLTMKFDMHVKQDLPFKQAIDERTSYLTATADWHAANWSNDGWSKVEQQPAPMRQTGTGAEELKTAAAGALNLSPCHPVTFCLSLFTFHVSPFRNGSTCNLS